MFQSIFSSEGRTGSQQNAATYASPRLHTYLPLPHIAYVRFADWEVPQGLSYVSHWTLYFQPERALRMGTYKMHLSVRLTKWWVVRCLRNEILEHVVTFVVDGNRKEYTTFDTPHEDFRAKQAISQSDVFNDSVDRIKKMNLQTLLSSLQKIGLSLHDYAITATASLSEYGQGLLQRTQDSKELKSEVAQLVAKISGSIKAVVFP